MTYKYNRIEELKAAIAEAKARKEALLGGIKEARHHIEIHERQELEEMQNSIASQVRWDRWIERDQHLTPETEGAYEIQGVHSTTLYQIADRLEVKLEAGDLEEQQQSQYTPEEDEHMMKRKETIKLTDEDELAPCLRLTAEDYETPEATDLDQEIRELEAELERLEGENGELEAQLREIKATKPPEATALRKAVYHLIRNTPRPARDHYTEGSFRELKASNDHLYKGLTALGLDLHIQKKVWGA